ncbi:MAG: hypothetical protein ACT4NU_07060 [Chromatiales bacterium]
MSARERPIHAVPRAALMLLVASLLMQGAWHHVRPAPEAHAEALPAPPALPVLQVLAAGDRIVLAQALMLWLQAFDNPPGLSIPFRDLDYGRVVAWLERVGSLDERTEYPLLAAARLYGEVPVPTKQRQMLDFVYREFLKNPNGRWQWLAHAVYVARHRIGDLALALKYADALATHARGPQVPKWARQMNIFVLEDMGEIEAAKILIGGLLEDGKVTDPAEQRFLMKRLQDLEKQSER